MPNAPGTLFVVATPIGNLEDITLRALRVLREVDVVAAEDTRRTGNLLRHYDIATPLLSVHEHNEHERIPQVLDRLRQGRSVALVSDAGTPGISDPGAHLVRAAREAGLPVTPIPGASSVAAAVSGAGLPVEPFAFAGFPPIKANNRKQWLEWAQSTPSVTVVAFEAPHRLRKTLTDLQSYLVNRPIMVARELTKLHEEWRLGTAEQHLAYFTEPQGEFVLLLLPVENTGVSEREPVDDPVVFALFGQITETNRGLSRRDTIREVAGRLGLTPKQVYDAIERAKGSPT